MLYFAGFNKHYGNSRLKVSFRISVTARIGFSVDLDLHEKSLRRIGSRWCKNHVELDLYGFVSVHFFPIQNEFVVRLRTLCPILHDETVI